MSPALGKGYIVFGAYMLTNADIVNVLIEEFGPLSPEEGVRYGNLKDELTGICVCWMATPESIAFAQSKGANFIICHEDLFLPYGKAEGSDVGSDFLSWDVNRGRIELLSKYNITVMRLHCSLDKRYILSAFADQLGLAEPIVSKGDYARIYEIEPTDLSSLLVRVKQALNLQGVRVAAKQPERKLRRVGLAWGGMGLFVNATFIQELLAEGCDVIIAGETDNYAMRMVLEAGVDVIETSHEISENAGLKNFAAELAKMMPNVQVCFCELPCCWKIA